MKKFPNKLFSRSLWSVITLFFVILFAILIVGTNVAKGYAGWINSFLGVDMYIRVDDSANETPDVMYYKSDFMQYRWYYNEETEKYEFQTRWNTDGLNSYIRSVSADVNAEGTVLLKNDNDALPLKENAKISLFGISQFPVKYITTGQGSGYHESNTKDSLNGMLTAGGVNVNPTLYNRYEIISQRYASGMENTFPNGDLNYVEFNVDEAPISEVVAAADGSVESYKDAAVFIISRLGSENGDTDFSAPGHVGNNYLDLTDEETGILDKLTEYKNAGKIDSIVLVLNTCNAMQFKTISDYPIDSILWVGTVGTSSFRALANVLTGKADPNGHLADTYAFDNYSAPSTVNTGNFTYAQSSGVPGIETYAHNNKYVVYQEGIYVGYKYYETRYEDIVMGNGNAEGTFGAKNSESDWSYEEEVAYPFGHGSSYAEFEHSDFNVSESNGKFTASLKITNIDDTHTGKDVFQLYLQKPYIDGGIEKASVELVGFAKTGELAPGESETLSVNVDMRDFASYDSYGAKTYVLDAGDYYLASGADSHDAVNNIIAAKGAVNEEFLTDEGDAGFTKKIVVDEPDAETYSVTAFTEAEITNRFDNADPNLSLEIAYAEGEIVKAQAERPGGDEPPYIEPTDPITEGTERIFEGETATLTAGSMGNISFNGPDNDESADAFDNTFLGNTNNNLGATLTFTVNADEETRAGLYLRLAFTIRTVNGIFSLQVNGEKVNVKSSFTAQGTVNWVTYEEYWLTNVDLVAGENVIVLTVTGHCGNFDYLKLIIPEEIPDPNEPITEGVTSAFQGETAVRGVGSMGAITVNADANTGDGTSLGNINKCRPNRGYTQ